MAVLSTDQSSHTYLAALHQLSLAVVNHLDLTEVLQAIVNHAAELMGTEHGYVYLLEPNEDTLWAAVAIGLFTQHKELRLRRGEGLAGRVWETGHALIVPDYDNWPDRSPQLPPKVAHAAVGVPLISAGRVTGVLGLLFTDASRRLDEQAVPALARFAQLAAIAIQNARLYGALQRELAERRQAETALRESEARWTRMLELAAEGVVVLDTENRISLFSPSAERIFGYAAAEVLGRPLDLLLPTRYAARHDRLIEQFVSEAFDRRMGSFRDITGRRRDGTEVPLEVSIGHLGTAEARGAVAALVRDISERRAAQQALRESEERYRSLFDRTNDAVFFISLDGRHLSVNQRAAELLGYTMDELLQLATADIVDPDEMREAQRRRLALLDGEVLPVYERTFRRKDGTALPAEVNVALVRSETGQPLYIQSVVRDIAERKRAQQAQEEANRRLAESLAQTEQRTHDLSLLSRMSEFLQGCREHTEAYAVVANHLQELFPQAVGALSLLNAERTLVERVVEWGRSDGQPADEPVFAPADCWGLRRGRLHTVVPPRAAPRCRHIASADSAYVCAPLLAQGEALGILHLSMPEAVSRPEGLNEARLQLVPALADNIALALSNLRLQESLRQQSIRDPLTGLFNRRYMEESLQRELARASRGGRPVGVIMLDVDHFKSFNDRFGHPAGDALLAAVGNFLPGQLRREDIACRYGGEEFTLILQDAPLSVVLQRAEWLRSRLEALQVEFAGRPLGAITCSLGVAVFPEHGTEPARLLAAADAALYQAKHAGRNCVLAASGPSASETNVSVRAG